MSCFEIPRRIPLAVGCAGTGVRRSFTSTNSQPGDTTKAKKIFILTLRGQATPVEQVQDVTWFKPVGEIVPFIPPFPSEKEIHEYVSLRPECRLVDDVDVCRAFNAMLADPAFDGALYQFYREQYDRFHGLAALEAQRRK